MRVLAILLLLSFAAQGQYRRMAKAQAGPVEKIAAVISGTIHTISKKEIGLNREGDNVMVFSIGRKTKFERDGKQVEWKAFQQGDEVTVQGEEDFPGHFAALSVKAKKPTVEPPAPTLQQR